jgi:predicted DNA-binding protein (UPF0251 family)/predicted Fe-Mo cluster-binding NifX family protein
MPRPRKARTLQSIPAPAIYIPAGWTERQSPAVEIAIEDFEIMRLTDGHNDTIEEAAHKVGVSRSTAGRMLERARKAIALGIEMRAPMYLDASEELVLTPPDEDAEENTQHAHHPESDMLAIACTSLDEKTPIERIFGRAHAFALSSCRDEAPTLFQNPGALKQRNAALSAARALKAEGVTRVVAGRYGPEAIKALAEVGIQPLVANGFQLGQALSLFQPTPAQHE